MSFFIPVWILWTLSILGGLLYFFIGWLHFAFDAGTSGNPGRLRYFFFWPIEWCSFFLGLLWAMIKPRGWK